MQVVKSIQEAGGKATAVKADVSKTDEVKTLFADAAAAFPDEKIEVGARASEREPRVCPSIKSVVTRTGRTRCLFCSYPRMSQ